MKNQLYVGNLSYDCTDSELSDHLSQVIQIEQVNLIRDRMTGRSRGFAFVTTKDAEQAKKAIDELHDQEFLGRKLIIREAYDSNERKNFSEGNRGNNRNNNRGSGRGYRKRNEY